MASTGAVSRMIVKVFGDITDFQSKMALMEANMATMGGNLTSVMGNANGAMGTVGSSMVSAGGLATSLGQTLTTKVGLPLAVLSGLALNFGVSFEKGFAGVRKTVEASDEEFDQLRANVRAVASETGVTNEKISGIMQVAGQLGIRGVDALSNFTTAIAKLNITTDVSSENLAMMAGRIFGIMGLNVEDNIEAFASSVTHLGNNFAATEDNILRFATRLAPIGNLAKLSAQDLLAIGTAADATGTKSERGGTALTKVFLKIQAEASGAKEATKNFQKAVTNNNAEIKKWTAELNAAKDAQANLGSNATSAQMQELANRISTAQEQLQVLNDTNEAYNDITKSAGTETLTFASYLGMSQKEFKELYQSTDGAITIYDKFLKKIDESASSYEDVLGIMQDLGVSDTRLVQTVLAMAQGTKEIINAETGLHETVSILDATRQASAEQYINSAGEIVNALDEEVNKKLQTVSGQLGRTREAFKNFGIILSSTANSALVTFLTNMNDALTTTLEKFEAMSPEQINSVVKSVLTLIALGPALVGFGGLVTGVGSAFVGISGIQGSITRGMAGDLTEGAKGMRKFFEEFGASLVDSENKLGKFKAKWSASWNDTPLQAPLAEGLHYDDAGRVRDEKGKFAKAVGPDGGEIVQPKQPGKIMNAITTPLKEVADSTSMWAKAQQDLVSSFVIAHPKLDAFVKLLATVAPFIKTLMVVMGGMAIVLAVVTVGLTAFFLGAGKSVEEANLILENVWLSIRNFGDKITEFLDGAMAKMTDSKFLKSFSTMFDTVLKGLGVILVEIIDQFWNIAPKFLEVAATFISTLLQGFVSKLPDILKVVVDIIMAMAEGFLTNLPTILKSIFTIVGSIVSALIDSIPMLLDAALRLIGAFFGLIWEMVKDGRLLAIAGAIIEGLVVGIGSLAWKLIEAGWQLFVNFIEMILEFLGIKSPSKKMFEIGEWIVEGLLNGIKFFFEILWGFWSGIGSRLLEAFKDAGKWLWGKGKDLLKGLKDGIWNYFTNVFKSWFNVGKWIKDAFVGAGNWLWSAGGNIMNGLKDGIFSKANQVASWASQIGGKLVSGVKNFFGIKSPSRLMRGLGANIGDGLAIGMEDSTRDILRASKDMENAALIDAKKLSSTMNIGGGTMTHDYSGLAFAFADALDAVGLTVYMDGREVTDKVAQELARNQRRQR